MEESIEKRNMDRSKFLKDVIHGYIKISDVCIKIIDQPEFQRLRNIKQLGFVSFVYPSANHTRFEHCIGVSYLAGKMARQLLDDNEDEKESWIKCAEIAGLCHDLGHGPFSHVYEQINPEFKHEKESVKVFETLCLRESLKDDITPKEQEIIKAMILPEDHQETIRKKDNKDKEFMFQIVSNDEAEVDVDKWDYLIRDAFYLGMTSRFEYSRLIAHAKAIVVNGKKHICYPLKLKEHIYEMFYLRRWSYKHAYEHRVVLCIGIMFRDAVKEAYNEKEIQALKDSTDAIYDRLRNMEEYEIISNIEKRELYTSLGGITGRQLFGKDKKQIKEPMEKFLEIFKGVDGLPSEDELRFGKNTFKYGKKAMEVFKNIYFYRKDDTETAEALEESEINPMFSETLAEPTYHFFSTQKGEFKVLKDKIKNFCKNT